MERLTNRHHFLYEASQYRGTPFHIARVALSEIVDISWHNELHANMPPPPKPSRPLVYNILNHLEEHQYSQPFDNVFSTVDYLTKVGNHETIPLAEHLIAQLGYVARTS